MNTCNCIWNGITSWRRCFLINLKSEFGYNRPPKMRRETHCKKQLLQKFVLQFNYGSNLGLIDHLFTCCVSSVCTEISFFWLLLLRELFLKTDVFSNIIVLTIEKNGKDPETSNKSLKRECQIQYLTGKCFLHFLSTQWL